MRNIIVLSEITYVPGNCDDFLSKLLSKQSKNIYGVITLNNLSFGIFLKIVWLFLNGCPEIATELCKNIFYDLLRNRDTLLRNYSVPHLKIKSMNQKDIIVWVKKNKIDCIFNVRTRCIYKKEILHTPKYGCFNIHHGLLPKYRGMYCDLYALYEGRPTGITLHKMNRKIDDGNIIYTKNVSDKKEKSYISYLEKTGKAESELINKFINYLLINKKIPNGRKNTSKSKIYTKTPSKQIINKIKLSGISL